MRERLTIKTETGYALKLDEPQNDQEAREQLMRQFKLACEKLGKIEDGEESAAESWVIKNKKGEYLSSISERTFTNILSFATLFTYKSKANFIIGLENFENCHPAKVKISEVEDE